MKTITIFFTDLHIGKEQMGKRIIIHSIPEEENIFDVLNKAAKKLNITMKTALRIIIHNETDETVVNYEKL